VGGWGGGKLCGGGGFLGGGGASVRLARERSRNTGSRGNMRQR